MLCSVDRRLGHRIVLEEDSDLRVYVVWFSMLAGGSRSGWDEKRLASQAFVGEVEGAAPPVWDAYLLYGPDATWDKAPPPPISSGNTVYGAQEEVEKQILRLLERGFGRHR
jgi:hypothetical protein